MKEMGSKISVVIILLAMVFLASMLFDATHQEMLSDREIGPPTYEDTVANQKKNSESLSFGAFSTEEDPYADQIAQVNFTSNPLAKSFESLITSSYDSVGVNFAAHYNISTWSCGNDCQNSAVIDVETGDIIAYGIQSRFGLSFSPSSRLLIINPAEQVPTELRASTSIATDYYALENDSLTLIEKEVNGKRMLQTCIMATTTARNFLTNDIQTFTTPCSVPFGWEIITN